jgi:hypothetical protein
MLVKEHPVWNDKNGVASETEMVTESQLPEERWRVSDKMSRDYKKVAKKVEPPPLVSLQQDILT